MSSPKNDTARPLATTSAKIFSITDREFWVKEASQADVVKVLKYGQWPERPELAQGVE